MGERCIVHSRESPTSKTQSGNLQWPPLEGNHWFTITYNQQDPKNYNLENVMHAVLIPVSLQGFLGPSDYHQD